jgi:hypothetical protein
MHNDPFCRTHLEGKQTTGVEIALMFIWVTLMFTCSAVEDLATRL